MSTALAIASVTEVLKGLLHKAMVAHSVTEALSGVFAVTALAPDRIKTGEDESPQLNLFLYHVAPNAGWSNIGLPSRDRRGERLTNPPLALDLYYLVTAYGKQDLDAEILLGHAMQALHDAPVLSRDAIRTAGGTVVKSELADQAELIKLSPQPMSTEEVSKLWSAFQANYRPSAAYHASVVLIESKHPARSPLPVLTRGSPDRLPGRDEGVVVQVGLVPPFPTFVEANPPSKQIAVRMGEVLTLHGHHLDGEVVMARFTHARSSRTLLLPASAGATEAGFDVSIPPDPPTDAPPPESPEHPDNWQAGLYSVAGVIRQSGEDRTTNELPVTLAPTLVSATPTADGGEVTVEVKCRPKVWKGQRVTLVVGDRESAAEPITADKTDTLQFKFQRSGLAGTKQWLRLRVDGIDSILVDRSATPPKFDTTQKVKIP